MNVKKKSLAIVAAFVLLSCSKKTPVDPAVVELSLIHI